MSVYDAQVETELDPNTTLIVQEDSASGVKEFYLIPDAGKLPEEKTLVGIDKTFLTRHGSVYAGVFHIGPYRLANMGYHQTKQMFIGRLDS